MAKQSVDTSCSLCKGSSNRYSKLSMWNTAMQHRLREFTELSTDSLICLACKEDVRRNLNKSTYQPRWDKDKPRCMVASCKWINLHVIKTTITTTETAGHLLECDTRANTVGELALCELHYKQLHRKFHANDEMYVNYSHCKLCNAVVKQRQLRHITNPDLINTFYLDSTAVDPELQSSDIVCFRCYKAHLLLTKSLCSSSTDEEIRELLESIEEMGVDNERFGGYENYIAEALKNTFIYVGNILLDSRYTSIGCFTCEHILPLSADGLLHCSKRLFTYMHLKG